MKRPLIQGLFLFLPKKSMFQFLARCNRLFLPSFTKQALDPAKAKKWQLAILAWRYYVTSRAINQ